MQLQAIAELVKGEQQPLDSLHTVMDQALIQKVRLSRIIDILAALKPDKTCVYAVLQGIPKRTEVRHTGRRSTVQDCSQRLLDSATPTVFEHVSM